jgi:hypothetical protein
MVGPSLGGGEMSIVDRFFRAIYTHAYAIAVGFILIVGLLIAVDVWVVWGWQWLAIEGIIAACIVAVLVGRRFSRSPTWQGILNDLFWFFLLIFSAVAIAGIALVWR